MKKHTKNPDIVNPREPKNPAKPESSKSRVPLVIGGIAAITVATLYAISRNEETQELTEEPQAQAETEVQHYEYEYTIDDMRVMSNTVPANEFMIAYEQAKNFIGGPYWNPGILYIEYGTVHEELMNEASPGHISQTLVEERKITTHPESMAHELVHYLIGPSNLPRILDEIIASAVDSDNHGFEYDELNQIYIRLPHEDNIMLYAPITTLRYAALQQVAHRYRDKWREVLQDALQLGDELTFENMANFLRQYGIEHEVLNPAETGEYYGIIKGTNEQGVEGFIILRLRKVEGASGEYPWTGPVQLYIRDINGNEYPPIINNVEGIRFFELPQELSYDEIDAVMAVFPDGRLQRDL